MPRSSGRSKYASNAYLDMLASNVAWNEPANRRLTARRPAVRAAELEEDEHDEDDGEAAVDLDHHDEAVDLLGDHDDEAATTTEAGPAAGKGDEVLLVRYLPGHGPLEPARRRSQRIRAAEAPPPSSPLATTPGLGRSRVVPPFGSARRGRANKCIHFKQRPLMEN